MTATNLQSPIGVPVQLGSVSQRIIDLWATRELSTDQIALALRISEAMVANVIAYHIDEPHKRQAQIDKSQKIYAEFRDGKSFVELSKAHKSTPAKIARLIGAMADNEVGAA